MKSVFSFSSRRILATFAAIGFLASITSGGSVSAYPDPGPAAGAEEPATFLPAPNPVPYCEEPTYLSSFVELLALDAADGNYDVDHTIDEDGDGDPTNDTGSQKISSFTAESGGGPTLSAVTNTFGAVWFQNYAVGGPYLWWPTYSDIGVMLSEDADVTLTLSEPLFYSQWVFTDIDQQSEGFEITPTWVGSPAAVVAYGGDVNFTFAGSTTSVIDFNDTDNVSAEGRDRRGRVQLDMFGPVTGIEALKTGDGGAGIATSGGCEALGVSKNVTSVAWDAEEQKYTAVYEISVNNNLPSQATLDQKVASAVAAVDSSFVGGTPAEIPIIELQLQDTLDSNGFSRAEVSSVTSSSGNVPINPDFDGASDTDVLQGSVTLLPQMTETFVMTVDYFLDPSHSGECPALSIENSVVATGIAAGAVVSDESDEGTDPSPSSFNGDGGPDDPTTVSFPAIDCSGLNIVKDTTTPQVAFDSPTGSVDLEYTVTVTNPSQVDRTTLPTDDLAAAFGATAGISNVDVTADGPCAGLENPSFGLGDPDLLTEAVILEASPAEGCTFDISFTLTAGGDTAVSASYTNVAQAVGHLTVYDETGQPVQGTSAVTTQATANTTTTEELHTLSGSVGSDTDGDGVEDTGLGGVTVTLVDADGNVVATTTTAADGSYSFADVHGGDYRIEQTDPAGYQSVSDIDGANDNTIEVSVSGDVDSLDFVDEPLATLSGSARRDIDGDGQSDEPMEGVTIELRDSDGNVVATTITAADGSYSFVDLPPGDYSVVEIDPDGHGSVSDADGGDTNITSVTMSGTDISNLDFVDEQLSTISGTVGEDVDGDGTSDGPISGVTIELRDRDGNVVATTTTAADGSYSFEGLASGEYTITEVDRDGFTSVDDADGGDDSLITLTVAPGSTIVDQDFLDVPPEASDDADRGNTLGEAVPVSVLDNDDPAITADMVQLINPETNELSSEVVVPGEGTWELDDMGVVTFTPEDGFEGDPTPISYQADYAGGGTTTAEVVVTYQPTATDDLSEGNLLGATATVDVLENDNGDLDPSTVQIIDPATGEAVTTLTVAGEGVWTVDPTTGEISFTPEDGFVKHPTPIDYQVTKTGCDVADSYPDCQPVEATVAVRYTPVADPDIVEDLAPGSEAVLSPLDNDEGEFDVASLRLIDPITGDPVSAVVVPGEGVWTVDLAAGTVTFEPAEGFEGDPTPIGYRVNTTDGETVQSTAAATYLDPVPPTTTTPTTSPSTTVAPSTTSPSTTSPSTTVAPTVSPATTQPSTLAFTGSTTSTLLAVGLALLVTGSAILLARRRLVG